MRARAGFGILDSVFMSLPGVPAPSNVCVDHPWEPRTAVCARCGDFVCDGCAGASDGAPRCVACVERLVEQAGPKLTFRLPGWSPVPARFPRECPGCGEPATRVLVLSVPREKVAWPHCEGCVARVGEIRAKARRQRWIGLGAVSVLVVGVVVFFVSRSGRVPQVGGLVGGVVGALLNGLGGNSAGAGVWISRLGYRQRRGGTSVLVGFTREDYARRFVARNAALLEGP